MEILTLLVGIAIAIFGSTGFWQFYSIRWKKKKDEETINPEDIKLMKEGMMAMLHDRLYHAYRYYLSKGEIDEDGYENLRSMYNSYHGLGGNGTGTELYIRCSKLKIVENMTDEKNI